MKANLKVATNEVVISDYTLIEDEGLLQLVSSRTVFTYAYQDNEERPGKHLFVIRGQRLMDLLEFLSFIELPVQVII
jgi:hypothetical protein